MVRAGTDGHEVLEADRVPHETRTSLVHVAQEPNMIRDDVTADFGMSRWSWRRRDKLTLNAETRTLVSQMLRVCFYIACLLTTTKHARETV
jgi:hypothetical protein